MSAYTLLTTLGENQLFRRKKAADYNLRDITELIFLYCIALHILRQEYETSAWAWKYANTTVIHSNFVANDVTNTDLYQALHVLSNHETNRHIHLSNDVDDLLWHAMSWHSQTAIRFLQNVASRSYNINQQRQLLLSMERQLNITTSNYRSVRRLSVEWDTGNIDTESKQLAITRLLQALRAKAYSGEILPQLQRLSRIKKYEIANVCDPETGKGCNTNSAASVTNLPSHPKMSFLQKLAAAAVIGAGAALINKKLGHR